MSVRLQNGCTHCSAHTTPTSTHNRPPVGVFIRGTSRPRATGAARLHPLQACAESATQHAKPHAAFYNALLEQKRVFRLHQTHPVDVAWQADETVSSGSSGEVAVAMAAGHEKAAAGGAALAAGGVAAGAGVGFAERKQGRTARHTHSKSSSQVIVWGSEDFV